MIKTPVVALARVAAQRIRKHQPAGQVHVHVGAGREGGELRSVRGRQLQQVHRLPLQLPVSNHHVDQSLRVHVNQRRLVGGGNWAQAAPTGGNWTDGMLMAFNEVDENG